MSAWFSNNISFCLETLTKIILLSNSPKPTIKPFIPFNTIPSPFFKLLEISWIISLERFEPYKKIFSPFRVRETIFFF